MLILFAAVHLTAHAQFSLINSMNAPKKLVGLSGVVIINLALQFLFQWYIIVSFGAGAVTDAYFGAMVIPQFILLVLSGSLSFVLVPVLSQYHGADFNKESWNYFQATGLLFGAIAILLFFSARWWVHLLFPVFSGAMYELSLDLSRIQLLAMVVSALLSVVWAARSAKEQFFVIETSSIIANCIALLLFYFAIRYYDIYAAAWVSVVRVLLQLVLLAAVLGPYHQPRFKSLSFGNTWKKIKPLLAGNMYYKTDMIVDRHLTSTGANGDLTLFNLAQQIYAAGNAVLSKVLVNTMVPQLAKAYHTSDHSKYQRLFKKRLLVSFIVTVAVLAAILLVGKWGLTAIFSFKNFSAAAISKLWYLLLILGGYWIGGLTGAITSSAFYACGNTTTPTLIGAINYTIFLPLKIFFYYRFGIQGLAITVSAAYLVSVSIQLLYLNKTLKKR